MIARSPALILSALILATVSTATGFIVAPGGYLSPLAGPALIGATGGITGSIFIGPISPTCLVYKNSTPVPSYYNQIEAVITPSSGLPATIPVNWVLEGGCWVYGTFKIGLNPGVYSVTLTSCLSQPSSFGCSQLPITAIVTSNSWTQVEISVRTGIE